MHFFRMHFLFIESFNKGTWEFTNILSRLVTLVDFFIFTYSVMQLKEQKSLPAFQNPLLYWFRIKAVEVERNAGNA